MSEKPLLALTAADIMTRDVVRLPEAMTLRDAARLLLHNRIEGAPVVDAEGKCVGVLSAFDFLRMAEKRAAATTPTAPALPITCSFQKAHRTPEGKAVVVCTLPPGVCPIQRKLVEAAGKEALVCTEPRCVLADWQLVDVEKLPADDVRHLMTPDPVTAAPTTPIRVLARMMVDVHIHRIIVVDEDGKPSGVVSSTDLLAALARSKDVQLAPAAMQTATVTPMP